MEIVASTTLNAKFDCPVKDGEESLLEHFASNVSEDVLFIDWSEWRSLCQPRRFRSLLAQ